MKSRLRERRSADETTPMKLLRVRYTWRQAACIASMPVVLAFIAFNILDLDGSNLASLTKSSDRFVIDAEFGAATRTDPFPERFEYFENNHSLLEIDDSSDRARLSDNRVTHALPSGEGPNSSL